MAILDIKIYPDIVLKKKALEIKKITEEIKKLAEALIETMEKNDGIGLAATQVGELKRIIVVKTEKGSEVFLNPKIIQKSRDSESMEEGCLSFPNLFLKIKRAKEIKLEVLNIKGEKVRIKTEGLLARVFQHEIDHLDGILLIDRVGFFRRICKSLKYSRKKHVNTGQVF